MPEIVAIATQDYDDFETWQEFIAPAIGTTRVLKPALLRSTEMTAAWLESVGSDCQLLILDARLPAKKNHPPDLSGQAVLGLIQDLRARGDRTPVLVLIQRRNFAPDLERYCSPANSAIALPIEKLGQKGVLSAFIGMLETPSVMTWNVIEIEVTETIARCYVGSTDGKLLKWGETPIIRTTIRTAASNFAKEDAYTRNGWAGDLRYIGSILFQTEVIETLGEGLYSHIENAAGGLSGLAFRFRVEDSKLHPIPFEASIRVREEDPEGSPFILLHAPVARRIPNAGPIRVASTNTARLQFPTRLLFVRSQMSEHPEGETMSDSLEIVERDSNTGGSHSRHFSFGKLLAIDIELEALRTLADRVGPSLLLLEELDLSTVQPGTAAQILLEKLLQGQYGIVHFAGHCKTTALGPTAKTLLVLPGAKVGIAGSIDIESFAQTAGKAGVRLVYLSSCQGSSTRSIMSLVQHGVFHSVGFRCEVEDARAAKFATDFYEDLFAKSQSICGAFCVACNKAHEALRDEGGEEVSPIWASPILVAQPDDWATQLR